MTDRERAAALADEISEFRDHVIAHAVVWDDAINGSHHHPIWAKLSEAIERLRRLAEQYAPSPAPADLRDVVAKAFEECEIGFSLQLIRLVDGVSTYLLSTTDGEPDAEFGDQEDAYAELGRRKAKARSDAALSAITAAGFVIIHGNMDWIHEANEIARAQWPCAALAAKEPTP